MLPTGDPDKIDVGHDLIPEMTAAQAKDKLIAFLIEHGVPIAPPPPLIEGEVEQNDKD